MLKNSQLIFLCISIMSISAASGQCLASAGQDIAICDGDGSSSNYTYLDGSGSVVDSGEVNYEWIVLNEVGDGSCLLYTSPSPRDLSTSRMPSSA